MHQREEEEERRVLEGQVVAMENWTFDRRVSMGHIFSIVIMLGALLGVYIELNGRSMTNQLRIENLERMADRQDRQISSQLEAINRKLDTHVDLHIRESERAPAR